MIDLTNQNWYRPEVLPSLQQIQENGEVKSGGDLKLSEVKNTVDYWESEDTLLENLRVISRMISEPSPGSRA